LRNGERLSRNFGSDDAASQVLLLEVFEREGILLSKHFVVKLHKHIISGLTLRNDGLIVLIEVGYSFSGTFV